MNDELDDLRDPPRLLEDEGAHASLRAIASMPELAPPPMPASVRGGVRDAIVTQTTPSRARWIAIGATSAVVVAVARRTSTR